MSEQGMDGAPQGAADEAADEPLVGEIVDEGRDRPTGPTMPPTAVKEDADRHRERSPLTFGAVLVVVGVVLLAYRFSDTLAAGSAPLVIGLGFITWWAMSGNFGLLVPGGVLGGIGLGMVFDAAGTSGDGVPLGLGLGFLAIYVLDAVRRREWSRWWPLVPGVVLVVVGLFSNTSAWDTLGGYGWPLILIVVGVVVLVVGLSRRGTRR